MSRYSYIRIRYKGNNNMSTVLYAIGFFIKLVFAFYTIIFLGDIFHIVFEYNIYKELDQKDIISIALTLLIKLGVITLTLLAFYTISFVRKKLFNEKNKFNSLEIKILLLITVLNILGRT